ncbi:hypothetical protein LIP66_11950 [Coprococcus eutactus]|nr:hypothetical protein [Coprococcus eutactus]
MPDPFHFWQKSPSYLHTHCKYTLGQTQQRNNQNSKYNISDLCRNFQLMT